MMQMFFSVGGRNYWGVKVSSGSFKKYVFKGINDFYFLVN